MYLEAGFYPRRFSSRTEGISLVAECATFSVEFIYWQCFQEKLFLSSFGWLGKLIGTVRLEGLQLK